MFVEVDIVVRNLLSILHIASSSRNFDHSEIFLGSPPLYDDCQCENNECFAVVFKASNVLKSNGSGSHECILSRAISFFLTGAIIFSQYFCIQ